MDAVDFATKAGRALAEQERRELNKGKGTRSKGYRTIAEMRRDAAQKALAILFILAILTAIAKMIKSFTRWAIQNFGVKIGSVIIACAVIMVASGFACPALLPFTISTLFFAWLAYVTLTSRFGDRLRRKFKPKTVTTTVVSLCAVMPLMMLCAGIAMLTAEPTTVQATAEERRVTAESHLRHQLVGKAFEEAKTIIDKNTDAAIAEINMAEGKDVEAVLREAQDEKEGARQLDGESPLQTETLRQNKFTASEHDEYVNVQNEPVENVCQSEIDTKQYLADHTKAVKQLADEIKKDVGYGEYYSTIMADSVIDNYERRLNSFAMEGPDDEVKTRIDKAYNECVNTLSNRWLKAKGN